VPVRAHREFVRFPVAILLISTLLPVVAFAQAADRQELRAWRATVPPKIDGLLDDELWSTEPLQLDVWMSYNPLRGEPEQQHTKVWIGFDDEAIYFAFRCYDTEPDKIRSTISRRDNVWNDDWVGVSLDSSRAGQIAYHMFVNPSGIQMDALQSANEDTSPDWLWQSAGRVDAEGYVVEIRLPLQSIRFKGGNDVRMGMLFFRKNSRLGVSWSWPEMKPGEWVFEAHSAVAFGELKQPLLLEVLPSATVSRNHVRTGQAWQDALSKGDLGASFKYGITSTMTLDATVNPDFSQVESDAFEVEVNQRYPIFFSEKRPFFMEGLGLFNLAGTGFDSTMRTAVHTRRIVDPSAGVKLTGTGGRYTFATLLAPDESVAPDGRKMFAIGRGLRNFGDGQYAGLLVTDTEFQGDFNRVIAADISLKHGDRFRWNGNMIVSESATEFSDSATGFGGQLSYSYDTRRVTVSGQLEHYSDDFRMDTAFINRVGITRGWQYQGLSFYPDEKRYPWLKRVNPFVWVTAADDRIQGGSELQVIPAIRFNFTRQGYLRLDVLRGHETFAHERFEVGRVFADGGAQITRWLNVGGNVNAGPAVYYDAVEPFQGDRRSINARVGLQPNAKLNYNLSYTFVHFERQETREKVFDVHVVNLRNTYQFTPQFLVRAILQHDSSRRRVLGDFLASYELVPGTVVHAGYGSLWERLDVDPYRPVARAFFFKASYLARF
jgi:Domain of unknown function (DUF5916)/Carbohydrate family 9 binding domain-like